MLIKDTINTNLIRLRQTKGLMQKEVAKALGIPMKRYQSYEEGRASPGFETIKKIVIYYGIDFNTFLSPFEVVFKPGNLN